MSKTHCIGAAASVFAVVALLAFAFWQSGDSSVGVSAAFAQASTPVAKQGKVSKRAALRDLYLQVLVGKFGVSADTAQQDPVAAEKETLQRAQARGLLTAGQVQRWQAKLDKHPGAGLFLRARVKTAHADKCQDRVTRKLDRPSRARDLIHATAQTVKLSPGDLVGQLCSGKTLADIARAQQVDATTIKNAIMEMLKTQIGRAVQENKLTRVQADRRLSRLSAERIDLTRPFNGRHWARLWKR